MKLKFWMVPAFGALGLEIGAVHFVGFWPPFLVTCGLMVFPGLLIWAELGDE